MSGGLLARDGASIVRRCPDSGAHGAKFSWLNALEPNGRDATHPCRRGAAVGAASAS